MKRKLFAAIKLLVMVVIAFAAGVSLVAKGDPKPTNSLELPEPRTVGTVNPFAPFKRDSAPPKSDPQTTEFIKLATTFAQTAEREELTRVLNDLQKKVAEIEARTIAAANEKEAARMVREAEHTLAAALAKYPDTVAGKRAEKMLNSTAEK